MLICLAGLLCALSVFLFVSRDKDADTRTNAEKGQITARNGKPDGKKARMRPRKQRAGRIDKDDDGAEAEGVKEKKKPTFALDEDDEAKLNEEQRRTIMAIRAALDNNDRKKVIRLVQTLQKSDEWPDGIPKSIKLAAIEALGWFGAGCLPELAGFLADSDEEVVQSAIERYEEMLSDIDLTDQERAEILVQASKVVNDADAMDTMLFELNNMSHATAIDTIKRIMVEGNAVAQSILPENVEFYTGEENMCSAEKLDEWLKQNPDEEEQPL